jgi:hypothetical protein
MEQKYNNNIVRRMNANTAIKAPLVLLSVLLLTTVGYSQETYIDDWVEFGIDISSNPAIGFNMGRVNYDNPVGSFNYISGYVIGFEGLRGKGEDYSDVVTRGMYPNDVKEEGYSYMHLGIRIGISTKSTFVPYAIAGYTVASLVQNRYDRSKILSNSGDYHISITDSDKSSFDFGGGLKVTPPSNSTGRLTLGFEISKNRGVSVVFNYSMLNINIW